METDVVEPFCDEVFVAGIKNISIVQQQNRGPLYEISLGDQAEAPSFKSVGDVLAGDDDAGLGNRKPVMRRAPLRYLSIHLFFWLEVNFEDSLKGPVHLVHSNFEQGKPPHHIQLRLGERRK